MKIAGKTIKGWAPFKGFLKGLRKNFLPDFGSVFGVSAGHSEVPARRYTSGFSTPAFVAKSTPRLGVVLSRSLAVPSLSHPATRLGASHPDMAAVPTAPVPAVFDLKSASLTLVALLLRTTDLSLLAQELQTRFADTPGLFDRDPLVIDLGAVADAQEPLDVPALVELLQRYKLQPIAAKGGSAAQMDAARAAGLVDAPEDGPAPAPRVVEVPAPPPEPVVVQVSAPSASTLIVDKPLRSGQQVYARGADLVVLAVVNFGAEVIADGSIHVYAPLRGRAIAGARGDTSARIFSTCMEPQLVSIAGTYRTTDTALPPDVHGKPAQVRLDGEKLVVEALKL